MPTAPFDVNAIREFAAVVAELIPDLRTDDLQAFPELQTEDALRDLIEHDSPVQLLCASAMALVRRPTEARGVLTELQVMAGRGEMSTPLAAIFDDIARAEAANARHRVAPDWTRRAAPSSRRRVDHRADARPAPGRAPPADAGDRPARNRQVVHHRADHPRRRRARPDGAALLEDEQGGGCRRREAARRTSAA